MTILQQPSSFIENHGAWFMWLTNTNTDNCYWTVTHFKVWFSLQVEWMTLNEKGSMRNLLSLLFERAFRIPTNCQVHFKYTGTVT